ncbi:hypothetical protein ACFYTC_18740 [Actinomadura nitritigenes]|uniref:hypothetical protein n=1 Tax=Actinomadura nitritigenes TaxID=134602 RepID=UPI0036B0F651
MDRWTGRRRICSEAEASFFKEVVGALAVLGESFQLEENARRAGVDVSGRNVFPGQQHTFQMAAGRAPEADDAIRRLADWVRPRLGLA